MTREVQGREYRMTLVTKTNVATTKRRVFGLRDAPSTCTWQYPALASNCIMPVSRRYVVLLYGVSIRPRQREQLRLFASEISATNRSSVVNTSRNSKLSHKVTRNIVMNIVMNIVVGIAITINTVATRT